MGDNQRMDLGGVPTVVIILVVIAITIGLMATVMDLFSTSMATASNIRTDSTSTSLNFTTGTVNLGNTQCVAINALTVHS